MEVRKELQKQRPSGDQLADAREVDSYIWVHSNSLIRNLTPFKDDAVIGLLNFLM